MRVQRVDWIPVNVQLSNGLLQDAEPTKEPTNYHVQRLWLNEEFTISSGSNEEIATIKPKYVKFRSLVLQVTPHVLCHIRDSDEFTLEEPINYNEYIPPVKIYTSNLIIEIDRLCLCEEGDETFDLIIQGENIQPGNKNRIAEET